ncbi:MAG TPA: CoA transferase [Solirubrobacteraceae bacterium]|nr:CoA transferase [Solirubrobacteraceae bacterium]
MSALAGLRVLELTQVMAGPFCGQVLADMGADVVKVEPLEGDATRRSLGFRMQGDDTAAFMAVNRNKRSLALDLKDERHQAVFHRLVGDADVVLENYRPGVAARLGADWETLSAVNPRLVYASVSGFGQTGPYAQRPGYDLIAQGLAGVMSVTGEPGGDPVKCGVPIGDLAAGLYCAVAIVSAIVARERTGRGQRIDTSLFECALALSIWETAELWATGRVPEPLGSAHRLLAPYQALRTADGHITVGGNTEELWRRLCDAVGRPELAEDPRFASNEERMAHRAELASELETALAARGADEWVALLSEAGVPCGPIHDYREVFADAHTQAREMEARVTHPVEGEMRALGIPVKLSDTPGGIRRPAPLLGEHTAEVLREAGLDEAEIAAL